MISKQQIQFTDDNYSTPEEVRNVVGPLAADSVWNEIILYRSRNKCLIDVSNIANLPYYLTLTEGIKAKLELTEGKIKQFYNLMSNAQKQAAAYEKAALLPSLQAISTLEKAEMPELSIKALFNGTYNEKDEKHIPVINYRLTALHFASFPLKAPDDIFLADAYERLLGHDVMTFYRYEDFDDTFSNRRFLFTGKNVYPYAPCHLIDPFAVSLYDFSQNRSFSSLVRALCSMFLIDQFKPFMDHNASLAALFAKDTLGYEKDDKKAFLVPLEPCLLPSRKLQVAINYSQTDGDLTYALLLMNDVLSAELDKAIKSINELRINVYSKEYRPDEEEIRSIENLSLVEETVEEKEEPEPVIEEKPAPVEEKKTTSFFIPDWKKIEEEGKKRMEEEQKAKEAAALAAKTEEVPEPEPEPEPIAVPAEKKPATQEKKVEIEQIEEAPSYSVSLPANQLSPAEIKEYAQYLIETNPRLSKKQAVFLANHCTVGRYYTVQDFKKSMKVVYETARTSMEKLATEGYYVKAQVKNKFVYTPRKKE